MSRHAAAVENADAKRNRKGKQQSQQQKGKHRTPSQTRYIDEQRSDLNAVKKLVRHIKAHPNDMQAWHALMLDERSVLVAKVRKIVAVPEARSVLSPHEKPMAASRGWARKLRRLALHAGWRKPVRDPEPLCTLETADGGFYAVHAGVDLGSVMRSREAAQKAAQKTEGEA